MSGFKLVKFVGDIFGNLKKLSKEEKIKSLLQQKLQIAPETFCHDLPFEMVQLMTYVKTLQTSNLDEKIDYEYLKKMFKNLVTKYIPWDAFEYDWISKAKLLSVHHKDADNKTSQEMIMPSNISNFPSEATERINERIQSQKSQNEEEFEHEAINEYSTSDSVMSSSACNYEIPDFKLNINTFEVLKRRNQRYFTQQEESKDSESQSPVKMSNFSKNYKKENKSE